MNFFHNRPWRRALIWLAVLAPFFYISYGLANYLAGLREHVPSIVFDWEHHIPFWAWTIFPYWSINLFYGLSLFLARTHHELRRHALRLLTAQIVAVTCFILMPLHFSFGAPPATGLAGLLFDGLRGFDKPFNQAPSLHIALAVILWDFYRRLLTSFWTRAVLHIWTWLICFSVLTTYQHHFIDIPTGALLGLLCVWAWPLNVEQPSMWRAWHLTKSQRRWRLGGYYFVAGLGVAVLACVLSGWALWLWWASVSLWIVALNYIGFGVDGFKMNASGRMDWSARILLAPYRLGAWLNQRFWTRRLPVSHEIVERLTIGRLPRTHEWYAKGKPTIISLCAELQVPALGQHHCVPCLDLTVPTLSDWQRSAAQIDHALSQGKSVHVCCALGFSRSVSAVLYWLISRGIVPNMDAGLLWLRDIYPHSVLNAELLNQLRQHTHDLHHHK